MSVPHHGDEAMRQQNNAELERMLKRFSAQVEGRAKRAFPEGRIHPGDDGELVYGVGADVDKSLVILDFGKQVTWLGLGPKDAVKLAESLIQKARLVSKEPLAVNVSISDPI